MAVPLPHEDLLVETLAKLDSQQESVELYERYYAGDHDLAFETAKFREAFGDQLKEFSTNWCGLVVDSPVQRLGVQGFRFGDEDAADEDAWQIWQANNLDAESRKAHTEAGKCGHCFLLVGPPGRRGEPRITVEHPSQVAVIRDPADSQHYLAAVKRYRDRDGSIVAVLYLPDEIVTYKTSGVMQRVAALGVEFPYGVGGGFGDFVHVGSVPNPLGVVVVVEMANRPGLTTGGISDLRPAIALNNAANKFFLDMLVASEYAAFPQRVITGVEQPKDPVTGEVLPESQVALRAALSRAWIFEDETAKVFDLKPADLGNYVQAIDLSVQHIAAQSQVPPHYLLSKLVNLSADALKAAETGLIAVCRLKQLDYSDAWEDAMRLSFLWRAKFGIGDRKADLRRAQTFDAETIWRDPESRAPGVIADSLVKKQQIGVPWRALMEEAGYSPQQIRRMSAMRERELLEAEAMSLFRGGANENGIEPGFAEAA